MNPNTKKLAAKLLKGKHFNLCVDLGCGEGYNGDVLKKHCDYLIGVDHNPSRLSVAKKFSGYNEVHLEEVTDYEIPAGTDAVFMFEIIEHIPKQAGFDLLLKLRHIPFIMLTTPTKFQSSLSIRNHHVSLWTEKELQEQGFKTTTFSYGLLTDIFYGYGIMAVKE